MLSLKNNFQYLDNDVKVLLKGISFFLAVLVSLAIIQFIPGIFSRIFNAECRFLAPSGCDDPQDTILLFLALAVFSIIIFFFVPIMVGSFYLSLRIFKKSNNLRVLLIGSIVNLIFLILFLVFFL